MDLKTRTLDGLAWSFVARLIIQVLQYVASVFIARLLLPDDFGLVAMVGAFTGVAGVFMDLGVGAAIVQRPNLTPEQTNAAFFATTAFGLVLLAVTFAGAPLVAAFYRRPELAVITRVLSLSFVLNSIGIVPRALLQRDFRFRSIAITDFLGNGSGSLLTLGLAIGGGGVWSIVAGSMTGTAVASALAWWAAGRPIPSIEVASIRPLLRVSMNLMAFNFINYWARNADNLIIGKMLGEHELGVYVRAYSLMMLAVSQIAGTVSGGMIPAMAAVQADRERSRRIYLRAVRMTAFVSFPMMVGLSACAETFMRTVYGTRWLEAIPILQVLAMVGAVQAVLSPVAWIFLSQGRTDRLLRMSLLTVPMIVAGFAIGAAFHSARAIAVSYLVTNILICIPEMRAAGACIDLKMIEILRTLWKSGLSASALWLAVWGFGRLLRGAPGGVMLVGQACVGGAVFLLAAHLLREPSLADARQIFTERWHRLRNRVTGSGRLG